MEKRREGSVETRSGKEKRGVSRNEEWKREERGKERRRGDKWKGRDRREREES